MNETVESPERLIRIGDLSRLTGLPVTALRRMADEGLLPVRRVAAGRHRRFPHDATMQRVRELMEIAPCRT